QDAPPINMLAPRVDNKPNVPKANVLRPKIRIPVETTISTGQRARTRSIISAPSMAPTPKQPSRVP
ncbi:MAG TPA: hypothetical protein VIX19_08680, partial [Terriglobales bacterium]